MDLQKADTYYDVQTTAQVRNKDDKIVSAKIILPDLLAIDELNGKYFRIVSKDTEEIIKIDSTGKNKESLRAATAYFHLTQARLFYKSIGVEQKELLTVRIGIENKFHKKYHFQDVTRGKMFNDAHTYAEGFGVTKYNIDIAAWGKEIWLRSPKKIAVSDEFKQQHRQLVRSLIPTNTYFDWDMLVLQTLSALVSHNPADYIESTGTSLMKSYSTNMSIKLIAPEISLMLTADHFHLDTALIPEIVVHEYTHFIMSDYLPTVENTPIMEGLSDYFATKITNNTKIAFKLGVHGELISERDSQQEVLYNRAFDSGRPGNLGSGAAYVLSVLTLIDSHFKRYERDINYAPKLFFEMRKHLTIDSKINDDLSRALMSAVPVKYRLSVLAILNQTGL
ncbi:MAG: hypothetical protein HON90_11150 [Halobacteriovoraceae bacterium]|nr:hypothetical protein [Halobacteriovoraceae bacterium]